MAPTAQQFTTPADEPVNQAVHRQPGARAWRTCSAAGSRRPSTRSPTSSCATACGGRVTWGQVREQAYRLAAGLVALGVAPEDRVAHRLEPPATSGPLADLAVMCAGGATTTIYPTTIASDVSYILSNSGSHGRLRRGRRAQLDKLRERPGRHSRRAQGRHLRRRPRRRLGHLASTSSSRWAWSCSTTNPGAVDDAHRRPRPRPAGHDHLHLGHHRPPQGRAADPRRLDLRGRRRRRHPHPEQGRPAVPLAAARPRLRQGAAHPAPADRLPHRHRRPGRQDRRQPRRREADLHGRGPAHLREGLRPHHDDDGRGGRPQGEAVPVGQRASAARSASCARRARSPRGCSPRSTPWPTSWCCTRCASASGAAIRFFISGSAALNKDVAAWFDAMGLLILEGYGLTETSAASFVNRPQRLPLGTRGLAPARHRGASIADDGEVLLRGPGVMEGYHNNAGGHRRDHRRRGVAAHR